MMKKVLLGLVAAAVMSSCIKREDSIATDQNSNLGTGTITGTVLSKTDYVGDTLANGAGDFNHSGVTAVAGATVIATWTASDLDPDNVNQGEMVFTTTTDASGNYTITVDANGEGTDVNVYVDFNGDISITHNCFNMGYDNTGTATSTTTSHELDIDYSYNTTVFSGQTDHRADWLGEADDALAANGGCY